MLLDAETLKLIKKKTQTDGFIDLPGDGNSMFPLVRKGDICRFLSVKPSQLFKGDIVLFYSDMGQLVAHRYIHTTKSNGLRFYYLKGDSNLGYDLPVLEEQIIGKLVFIQKKNRKIRINDFSASLWGWLILSFPAISGFIRKYLNSKYQLPS
jgi:signal peptidase I